MEENQENAIRVYEEHIVVRGVLFDVVRNTVRFPALYGAELPKTGPVDYQSGELPTPEYLKSLTSSNIPKGPLILDRALAEVKTGLVNY